MATVRIPIDNGKRLQMIPVDGEQPRQKLQYENGQRTDKAVLRDGRPVFSFEAAIALDGQALGTGRVESAMNELPVAGFGDLFQGVGHSELVIGSQDQFNLRVTVATERVERVGAQK